MVSMKFFLPLFLIPHTLRAMSNMTTKTEPVRALNLAGGLNGFWHLGKRCTRARVSKGKLQVRELVSDLWVTVTGIITDAHGVEVL